MFLREILFGSVLQLPDPAFLVPSLTLGWCASKMHLLKKTYSTQVILLFTIRNGPYYKHTWHEKILFLGQFMNWPTASQFVVKSSPNTGNLNKVSFLRWKFHTRGRFSRHLKNNSLPATRLVWKCWQFALNWTAYPSWGRVIKYVDLQDTWNGLQSSHLRVLSPEVMSPETQVMLPEILVISPKKKSQVPRRNKY